MGLITQIFLEGDDDEDFQIGCVWFYRPREAFAVMGKEGVPVHHKELFFSVHFDEPGAAAEVLQRKIKKVLFFPSPPNLDDAGVKAQIEKV